jgi:hypothetical protein
VRPESHGQSHRGPSQKPLPANRSGITPSLDVRLAC